MSPATAIRRVTLHRVRVPLRQAYASAKFVLRDVVRTIVEIETGDGRVGLGEMPGSDDVQHVAAQLARTFIGQPVLERLPRRQAFAASVFDNRNGRNGWSAFGGLELAMWDWAGGHFGLPVHALLGGAVRHEIDVVCPVPALVLDGTEPRSEWQALFRDRARIDDVVGYCLAQRDRFGFRCFKYKSAGLDASWDVDLLYALRRALGPDVGLRWDPNAAYPVSTAAVVCGRLDDVGLEFHEDPTDDISGMASLRGRTRAPLATNMCVVQFDHLASAVRHRPADILLADVYMWGGVESFLAMAAVATAYDFEVALHSFFETGIGTAANLHLAAALPAIRRASDCGLHVLAYDVVDGDALTIAAGRMRVPGGCGWGVTLNRDAVAEGLVSRVEIA